MSGCEGCWDDEDDPIEMQRQRYMQYQMERKPGEGWHEYLKRTEEERKYSPAEQHEYYKNRRGGEYMQEYWERKAKEEESCQEETKEPEDEPTEVTEEEDVDAPESSKPIESKTERLKKKYSSDKRDRRGHRCPDGR